MMFLVVAGTCGRGLDDYAVTTCSKHAEFIKSLQLLLFISFWLGKRPYACFCKLANTLMVSVNIVDGLEQGPPKLLLLTVLDSEASFPIASLLS